MNHGEYIKLVHDESQPCQVFRFDTHLETSFKSEKMRVQN